MKIIELTLDELEDFGGLDAISLVEKPAHESNFLAFSKDIKNIYEVLTPEQLYELAVEINKLGEPAGKLEAEGWKLEKIEEITDPNQFQINVISNPNELSGEDSEGAYRIRYRYTGPRDSKNRAFCAEMLRQNRVFRREDIDDMTTAVSNPEFGFYSIWEFRGSYNCRHYWQKLTYKWEGNIINKARSRRGITSIDDIPNEPTITEATANAKARRARTNINASMVKMGVIDLIDDVPVFSEREEAEIMAEKIGCSGSHEHQLEDGVIGYMPCEKHMFQTYNDYPKAASENACRAVKYAEENGWGSCGTDVGKQRAHQLCKNENISEETIARMAAFERHRRNSDTPYGEGCGKLMWDAWGGDEGIEWAQRKLKEIREDMGIDLGGKGLAPYVDETGGVVITGDTDEKFLYENPCQSGYIAYGTKIKNGRKVPNCVKQSQSKDFTFSANEDKMEITGAAIIPNKLIIRKSPPTIDKPNGELYWVFFSEETTRKLADKYMKEKLLDASNVEHSNKEAKSRVIESWIVEDPIFDKSTALGLEYPKGTWVITMRVEDPNVWEEVKTGKLNGYSIEGWFNEEIVFSKINK